MQVKSYFALFSVAYSVGRCGIRQGCERRSFFARAVRFGDQASGCRAEFYHTQEESPWLEVSEADLPPMLLII